MSGFEAQKDNNKIYLNIVKGELRRSVEKGTPNAIAREWEAGGKTGVKHELKYPPVFGIIEDVEIYEGESGGKKFQSLNIVFDANEEGLKPVVCASIGTRYATDLLKKLPAIDFTKEVRIFPYSYIPEGKDKPITGVQVTQRDHSGEFTVKIPSYFHYQDGEGKWHAKNGYPEPTGDTSTYSSKHWEIFYGQAELFLLDYLKEKLLPTFHKTELDKVFDKPKAAKEISLDDIPF